jgi:hypothetical protein
MRISTYTTSPRRPESLCCPRPQTYSLGKPIHAGRRRQVCDDPPHQPGDEPSHHADHNRRKQVGQKPEELIQERLNRKEDAHQPERLQDSRQKQQEHEPEQDISDGCGDPTTVQSLVEAGRPSHTHDDEAYDSRNDPADDQQDNSADQAWQKRRDRRAQLAQNIRHGGAPFHTGCIQTGQKLRYARDGAQAQSARAGAVRVFPMFK